MRIIYRRLKILTEREKRDSAIDKEIRKRLTRRIVRFLKVRPNVGVRTILRELKIESKLAERLVPEVRDHMAHNSALSLETRVQKLLQRDENIYAFDISGGHYIYHVGAIKRETGATKETLQRIISGYKHKQSETAERRILGRMFNPKYFRNSGVKVDALAKILRIWPEQVEFILKKNGLDNYVFQNIAAIAQGLGAAPETIGKIYLATQNPYFRSHDGEINRLLIARHLNLSGSSINYVDKVCESVLISKH